MTSQPGNAIFDRKLVRQHRQRAANQGESSPADFLFNQDAVDLTDRLEGINRTFEQVLVTGARRGAVAQALTQRGFASSLVQADFAQTSATNLVLDEDWLPISPQSLDLIISTLSLHWVNDLPGALVQMQQALRPDGLLLASIFGGQTLFELRQVLLDVEAALIGGASPRVNPAIDLRDAAGLLQRTGFALPVADANLIEVTYASALDLLKDLRAMGETSALRLRDKRIPPRAFWPMVVDRYASRFSGPDGRISATFEIFTLTGWHPDESQQKPLRPGSAKTSLAAHLGTTEKPAGDKVG